MKAVKVYGAYIVTAILLLSSVAAKAQFYTAGDDKFSRWYSIESENYKVIYPTGLDSLAREYARAMERFRRPVGLTSGYIPGEKTRGKMPVVLHSQNAVSNGSVAWAPKRMDAFTIPQIYGAEAHPWIDQLAVHESRHISQMQFGLDHTQGVIGWFFGEMWNGLTAGIYTESSFLEGDAVIAETELTKSGRGRKADFLNYYMVSFDQGDLRDWDQWRYGSQKKYTPDWYALGYLTYGGMRWLYDRDDYTAEYLDYASRHFFRFDVREVMAKKTTGKDLVNSFPAIRDSVTSVWRHDAELRRPYMPVEIISAEPRKTADYENLTIVDDKLYALKHGHNDNWKLVCIDIDDREEEFVSYFNGNSGRFSHCPHSSRLYWSESVPDARWTLRYTSDLKYADLDDFRIKTLKSGEWDYNPAVAPDDMKIASIGIRPEGGCFLSLLEEGREVREYEVPDSLQLTDLAWAGQDKLCATGISAGGTGIYEMDLNSAGVEWTMLLAPSPVQIESMHADAGYVLFTSDRTGVNEFYALSLADGTLRQLTSTRYGGKDYCFDSGYEYVYYSSMTLKGQMVCRTPVSELPVRKADWNERYKWPIAEKLSEQARRRAEKLYGDPDFIAHEAARVDTMQISAPKRYHKFPHLFNVHSWAPFYANIPALMNDLGDDIFQNLRLGATAVMQNRLGTFSGIAGYAIHPDTYDKSRWRNSAHLHLKYSGLYPVFELDLDFNDRAARQGQVVLQQTGVNSLGVRYSEKAQPSVPNVSGSLSAYIPFKFSHGGWYSGLTPRLSYSISNDRRDANAYIFSTDNFLHPELIVDGGTSQPVYTGKMQSQKNLPRQNLSATLSYYTLLPTTTAAAFPRWGGGLQAGVSLPLGMTHWMSPTAFGYAYGYFPGVVPEQGLRVSGMWQGRIPSIENGKSYDGAPFRSSMVDVLPRGLQDANLRSALTSRTDNLWKLSADYSIPIYIGDKSLLWSCLYFRRMLLTPHFDCTLFNKAGIAAGTKGCGTLMSYGFDLAVDIECILWLIIPCQIGIRVDFNGAPGWNGLDNLGKALGTKLPKYYIGPVFSINMF